MNTFLAACEQGDYDYLNSSLNPNLLNRLFKKKQFNQDDLNAGLLISIMSGHENIVTLLVEKGANLKIKDNEGNTPLKLAISLEAENIVTLLIDKGCSLAEIDSYDPPILMGLIHDGKHGMAKVLIESGANPNLGTEEGFTPLYAAVLKKNIDLASLLISKGADVNAVTSDNTTIFDAALDLEDVNFLNKLVKLGCNINYPNSNQNTPLLKALLNGFWDIAMFLLKVGADANIKGEEGRSALAIAIENNKQNIVERILPNLNDPSEEMIAAIFIGNAEQTENVLNQKNDIGNIEIGNLNGLLYAIKNKYSDVAKVLETNNIGIESKDHENKNTLMYSIIYGDDELAQSIAPKLKDINEKDNYGFSAIEIACMLQNDKIYQLLKELGADDEIQSLIELYGESKSFETGCQAISKLDKTLCFVDDQIDKTKDASLKGRRDHFAKKYQEFLIQFLSDTNDAKKCQNICNNVTNAKFLKELSGDEAFNSFHGMKKRVVEKMFETIDQKDKNNAENQGKTPEQFPKSEEYKNASFLDNVALEMIQNDNQYSPLKDPIEIISIVLSKSDCFNMVKCCKLCAEHSVDDSEKWIWVEYGKSFFKSVESQISQDEIPIRMRSIEYQYICDTLFRFMREDELHPALKEAFDKILPHAPKGNWRNH